jgi:NADH-quinone oxidoreductase subunit H
MQSRIGPYRVGPHGLLQPIADALKLMMRKT